MNIQQSFQILGIPETTQTNQIQKAYRSMLAKNHPEENPEGFKQLRKAYETALNYANGAVQTSLEQPAPSPVDTWFTKVQETYRSIRLRQSVQAWTRLLEDPVCQDLDDAQEAQEKLLLFLQNHPFLPSSVFALLDDVYDIESRQENLKDFLAPEFVHYLVNGIHNFHRAKTCSLHLSARDVLRLTFPEFDGGDFSFHLLSGDEYADYDNFIRQLFSLYHSLNQGDLTGAKQYIAAMDNLQISHPQYDLAKARLAALCGDFDSALASCDSLMQAYPTYNVFALYKGEILWRAGRIAEAVEIFKSFAALGNVSMASAYLSKQYAGKELQKKALAECLAWRKTLEEEHAPDRLLALSYYYEAQINFLLLSEENAYAAQEDYCRATVGAIDLAIAIDSQIEYHQLRIDILMTQGKNHESGNWEEVAALYEQAASEAEATLALDPKWFPALQQAVIANFTLRRYQEVIRYYFRSLELYGNLVQLHEIAAETFLIYEQYLDAQRVLDYAKEKGCDSLRLKLLDIRCKRITLQYDSLSHISRIGLYTETMALIQASEKEGADDKLIAELYFELSTIVITDHEYTPILDSLKEQMPLCTPEEAILNAIDLDPDPRYYNYYGCLELDARNYKNALEQFQKVMNMRVYWMKKYGGQYDKLLYHMAVCHSHLNNWQEAVNCFTAVLEVNPQYPYINGWLAELYQKRIRVSRKNGETALLYATKQIELTPQEADAYRYRGQIYLDMEDYDAAMADAKAALALDKNNFYSLHFMAKVCVATAKYTQGEYYVKQAVSAASQKELEQNLSVYNTAGDCCRRAKHYDDAIQWLLQGMNALDGKYRYGFYPNLFWVYQDIGDAQKAGVLIQEFFEGSYWKPFIKGMHENTALITVFDNIAYLFQAEYMEFYRLMLKGDYVSMAHAVSHAIDNNPENGDYYILYAFALHWSASNALKESQCYQYLTKALTFYPDDIYVLRTRVDLARTKKRYEESGIPDLTRLITLDRGNAVCYILARAYLYKWTGQTAAAKDDLNTVLESGDAMQKQEAEQLLSDILREETNSRSDAF